MPALSIAGLLVAPAIWVANSQAGLVLPHVECRAGLLLSLFGCCVGALLSAAGAGLSFAATAGALSRLRRFIGLMSGLAGLIFTYALLLQGAAALLIDRCQS